LDDAPDEGDVMSKIVITHSVVAEPVKDFETRAG